MHERHSQLDSVHGSTSITVWYVDVGAQVVKCNASIKVCLVSCCTCQLHAHVLRGRLRCHVRYRAMACEVKQSFHVSCVKCHVWCSPILPPLASFCTCARLHHGDSGGRRPARTPSHTHGTYPWLEMQLFRTEIYRASVGAMERASFMSGWQALPQSFLFLNPTSLFRLGARAMDMLTRVSIDSSEQCTCSLVSHSGTRHERLRTKCPDARATKTLDVQHTPSSPTR